MSTAKSKLYSFFIHLKWKLRNSSMKGVFKKKSPALGNLSLKIFAILEACKKR